MKQSELCFLLTFSIKIKITFFYWQNIDPFRSLISFRKLIGKLLLCHKEYASPIGVAFFKKKARSLFLISNLVKEQF